MSSYLPADIAEKLLNQLGTSDSFRDLFQKNPREALRKIGYETPAADRDWAGRDPILPLYQLKGGLASKEKILADKNTLLAAYRNLGGAAPARLTASAGGGGAAPLPFSPFAMCCDD